MKEKIIGRWSGRYYYDAPEMQATHNAGVGFEVNITQSFLQRILRCFSGEVQDNAPEGVPGRGSVVGSFRFGIVRFIKRLPEFYIFDGSKNVPFHEFIKDRWGLETYLRFSHPPVSYNGRFTDPSRIEGSWLMGGRNLPLDDMGSELPLLEVRGTFVMVKERSDA